MSKFMQRIFSAQENQESEILNQFQSDLEVAKEDGVISTDEYDIRYKDGLYYVEDKVNDEESVLIDADGIYQEVDPKGGSVERTYSLDEIAAVVIKNEDNTYEVISIEEKEDWKRLESYKKEGCRVIRKFKSTGEADKYIEERNLPRAYSKTFSSAKNKTLIMRIGDYDIELNAEEGVANVLDENYAFKLDFKKPFEKLIDEIKDKLKKEGLKNFSESNEKYYVCYQDEDNKWHRETTTSKDRSIISSELRDISNGEFMVFKDSDDCDDMVDACNGIENARSREEAEKYHDKYNELLDKCFSECTQTFGNPVSNDIPAGIGDKLQDIAQMTGLISYSDIYKLKDSPELRRIVTNFYRWCLRHEAHTNEGRIEIMKSDRAKRFAEYIKTGKMPDDKKFSKFSEKTAKYFSAPEDFMMIYYVGYIKDDSPYLNGKKHAEIIKGNDRWQDSDSEYRKYLRDQYGMPISSLKITRKKSELADLEKEVNNKMQEYLSK